jgi:hypothetical protein
MVLIYNFSHGTGKCHLFEDSVTHRGMPFDEGKLILLRTPGLLRMAVGVAILPMS